MPKFTFDPASYYANLEANGHRLSAQQQADATKIIQEHLKDGDIVSTGINGFWGAIKAILSFIGLGHLSLGDRLGTAIDTGQQQANQHTAQETAMNIHSDLLKKGFPRALADRMTGEVTTQPEMAGNLFRYFRAQSNGGGPPINPPAATTPSLATLASSNPSYPVADNPTVLAQQSLPAGNVTRALTGNTPPA